MLNKSVVLIIDTYLTPLLKQNVQYKVWPQESLQTILIPVSSSFSALHGCTVLPLKLWINGNAFCPHGSTHYDVYNKGFIYMLKNRREITAKKMQE